MISLEVEPQLNEVFEFHVSGSYSYKWYDSVSHSLEAFDRNAHEHALLVGMDFVFLPDMSIDGEVDFAFSNVKEKGFRSLAMQLRYLLFNDVAGDFLSTVFSFSGRVVSSNSLKDISSPYHGREEFGFKISIGKELFDKINLWGYGNIGFTEKGNCWLDGAIVLDLKLKERDRISFMMDSTIGFGKHKFIDVNHFHGYGKIKERNIDLILSYVHIFDIWGSLILKYQRRLFAYSCPKNVNGLIFTYSYPFSL